MQVVRTIVWVLLAVALALFSIANWTPVTLHVWSGLLIDTMLPALVILAFALGFVPMWLLHRTAMWQSKRRIAALELAARPVVTTAPSPVAPAPPPPPVTTTPDPLGPDA
jgi:lipopolysaccharide assembly protein A